ncbi:hypothetical protein J1N35_031857 [Gossypium stocksii]|uniref:Uncharacterized protein n=1 Tax=Gossypium stocksii TaxID=47602 RepID=A0A9D3V2E5_9ROSI|nr:hypothetical protein J1N35_031857 [Gossypium stocksii]
MLRTHSQYVESYMDRRRSHLVNESYGREAKATIIATIQRLTNDGSAVKGLSSLLCLDSMYILYR